MSVRIRLTKENDSKPERDVVLDQEVVSIGREAGNTLQLAGTLVSKKHARIEGRDRAYRLIDLRSTNSTFLNDKMLVPDRPYELHLGDRVRIGEFALEIVGFGAEASGKEVVAQKGSPPAPMVEIEARLAQVAEEYSGPLYIQKRAHLKQALTELIGRLESSDVQALSTSLRQAESECERLKEENRRLLESLENLSRQSRQPEPQPPVRVEAVSTDTASMQLLTRAMKSFLNAFSRLVRGRSSFRNEFLGVTMVSEGELSPLLSGSSDTGIHFLLAESASEGESAARAAALQRSLDEVSFHVVGLLDGYRTSIDDGVRKLLQKTSPEVLRSQLAHSKLKVGPLEVPYTSVPFLLDWKVMQLSNRLHQELQREDRGVLEKRYFRGGFIQGYEKCIASLRSNLAVQRDPQDE